MQISKIKIGQTIKVGDLFEEVSSLVPLMGDQVQVFVSAVDELSAIKFVYDDGADKIGKMVLLQSPKALVILPFQSPTTTSAKPQP